MFRNYSSSDLKELIKIDSVSFMQHYHFTFDPCPELMQHSTELPNPKKTKQDQENETRINETIKKLKACI